MRPWLKAGRWRASLKLWHRVPESDRGSDPNPDILDFYGNHELRPGYVFSDGDWMELTSRHVFPENRGSVRLRFARPTAARNSYLFFELFSGFGESLNAFREDRTSGGVGFAIIG